MINKKINNKQKKIKKKQLKKKNNQRIFYKLIIYLIIKMIILTQKMSTLISINQDKNWEKDHSQQLEKQLQN